MASTISVNAPANAVWMALTDAYRWPEWCRACPEVSTAPDTWSPGEALSFKLRMAGVAVPFNVRLSDVEPGRRVSWVSKKFTITAVRTISLEPRDGHVTVLDHKRFAALVRPVCLYSPRFRSSPIPQTSPPQSTPDAERLAN